MHSLRDEYGEGLLFLSDETAAVVLDGRGTVLFWTDAARGLLGYTADEVRGRPLDGLIADGDGEPGAAARLGTGEIAGWRARLRRRDGREVDFHIEAVPLDPPRRSPTLLLLTEAGTADDWRENQALAGALFAQQETGFGVTDQQLHWKRVNIRPYGLGENESLRGEALRRASPPEDLAKTRQLMREVLATGEPASWEQEVYGFRGEGSRTQVAVTAICLKDRDGRTLGVATTAVDVTERNAALRRLELLHNAASRVGRSLDVTRTAQDVAAALVPEFTPTAIVELDEAVLTGDEPPAEVPADGLRMRRAAVAHVGEWPANLLRPGEPIPSEIASWFFLGAGMGEVHLLPDVYLARHRLLSPAGLDNLLPRDAHCGIIAPLHARGRMLGTVSIYRDAQRPCFDSEDAKLLGEIGSRAGLGLDNARRYTREHRRAVALQRSLLPPAVTETAAARTAGAYVPAITGEVAGDWYDVVSLSSLRVAFVVGDVFGHGLQASATMGRLRTAVQTLAELDLEPGELLARLDDLVSRLSAERAGERGGAELGATVLYAVYDPVVRRLAVSSAGHPAPLLVHPDGRVAQLDLEPGPPLGVGGMPFETVEVDVAPDSVLAFFTDGLLGNASRDIDVGLKDLVGLLSGGRGNELSLDALSSDLLYHLLPEAPADDAALLLARTRAVPAESVASWELPAEPSAAGVARRLAGRQLAAWELDDLSFATELVVSELVTNAARYAGGPIVLRLINDRMLVCEVSDPSNTQPRLLRATSTDEGGRGLFLVAQTTDRWGCRYGRSGKTIWTEQSLSRTPVWRLET